MPGEQTDEMGKTATGRAVMAQMPPPVMPEQTAAREAVYRCTGIRSPLPVDYSFYCQAVTGVMEATEDGAVAEAAARGFVPGVMEVTEGMAQPEGMAAMEGTFCYNTTTWPGILAK